MTEKKTQAEAPTPPEQPLPTKREVAKSEAAKLDEREATADQAAEAVAVSPHTHGPSSPDQASEADKEVATAMTAPFRGVETEYAPDNEIEATVRRMAGEGATAGEIAAYRADALAKIADD